MLAGAHNTREHGSAQTRHKLRKRQYISSQTVRAISKFTVADTYLNGIEAKRKAALAVIRVNYRLSQNVIQLF